ncbi:DUF3368 domain-containing protein [Opitutaceae bacterium TAV4]|nr:DUF3368 domain-containing protein [Opitutaceae bacterium TAV4]RRK00011.1 DUF3368 domain-containing protein [Opitutaceae bacterium TAV3]
MSSPKREPLIICDAGPLILLAKVGRIDLLAAMSDEIWIPSAVWHEVVVNSGSREEVRMIQKHFPANVRTADPVLEAAFGLQVDAGEAAALALAARNPGACLLMDDKRGRAIARLQGLRCIGTLGWLVRAKRQGFVEELRPLFDSLLASGWFVSPHLIERTLIEAGEFRP